jgi:hypothetical protein
MGLKRLQGQLSHEGTRTSGEADTTPHTALESCERELFRVRLELAELKRTGSCQGFANLSSKAAELSMRMKRIEALVTQSKKAKLGNADTKELAFSP